MNRMVVAALVVGFGAGLVASRMGSVAVAQAPAVLQPAIIDLAALTDTDLGPIVPGIRTLRSRTLVVHPHGTIAVQSGNAPRHTHSDADEFQYVVAGSGTFWLGDQPREVHPGDLIVIPRGTVHAGSVPSSGEFKVLAIKLPPQPAGDYHPVP